MSAQLKKYDPTEKGRELIALLFPLSQQERAENILNYWKQYPQESKALMDGFHFLVQEMIETRNSGSGEGTLNLPKDLINIIIKQMYENQNFFSYEKSEDFFNTVTGYKPPIFSSFKDIQQALVHYSKPKSEIKSKFNLPDIFDEAIEKKFKSICKDAEVACDQISKIIRSLRESHKVIDSFQDVNASISLIDVKLAKETLLESKKAFNQNGKIIADGLEYISDVYRKYPKQLELKKPYIKYLAKLLVSREARHPAENYVITLAEGDFSFDLPDFEPTDKELHHGKTHLNLKKEYEETLMKDSNRLEARYRKRKLTVMLKKMVPKQKIIVELKAILKMDPIDIRSHIFLAKLYAEISGSMANHIKRSAFREEALKHCEIAFAKIDDYLNLQEIKKINTRDQIRAGFVKTISAVRIPLIRKK